MNNFIQKYLNKKIKLSQKMIMIIIKTTNNIQNLINKHNHLKKLNNMNKINNTLIVNPTKMKNNKLNKTNNIQKNKIMMNRKSSIPSNTMSILKMNMDKRILKLKEHKNRKSKYNIQKSTTSN